MFSFAVKVDIGVYEESNDDRALIVNHIVTDGELCGKINHDHIVATICDGVGGLAQGYRAAMMTLETVSQLNAFGRSEEDIRQLIEAANQKIRQCQIDENLRNGLRTTIAGIYADASHFFVYNAGDSRVYRFRYKFFSQLSKDHSFVQDLVDMGKITPEEAKDHPKKNIITKCIGNEDIVNPRITDMSDDFMEGDIIMICSDGISDEVLDQEFKEIIFEHKKDESLDICCAELMDKAIRNGSKDNMSVILVRKEN